MGAFNIRTKYKKKTNAESRKTERKEEKIR